MTTLGKLLIFLLLLLSWGRIVLLMQRWWQSAGHVAWLICLLGHDWSDLAAAAAAAAGVIDLYWSPYVFSHCQCEMHFQVNWVELGISSVTADQIPLFWLLILKILSKGPKLRRKELKQVQGQDMRVPTGTYSKYACSGCPLIPGTPLIPSLKKKICLKCHSTLTVFFTFMREPTWLHILCYIARQLIHRWNLGFLLLP